MTQQSVWDAPGGYDQSRPGGPGDSFDDLDSFAGDYRPEAAFPLDVDALANGDYDLEILRAELKYAQGTTDRIVELMLQILSGQRVRWTWWLNKQNSVNTACADLAALGFPAQSWGAGPGKVPLSKAIPDAVAKLPGIKFRAHKSSREDKRPGMNNRVYHNLAISCRLDSRPMPPLTPPPAQPAAATAAPAGGDVPF